ncbi:M23 family metallopeptidase [Streptomyces ziwulingensis]|uniref:M23 family metallopeptidase n=2 Tax=Streptomyces TaxID=1883 RepID=A0ABP9CG95_9ACTN
MNDRHPSGTMTTPASASDADAAHYASYGTQEAAYGDFITHNGYDTTGYSSPSSTGGSFAADPLFGSLPGQNTGAYDAQAAAAFDTTGSSHATGAYDDTTGGYDTAPWATGAHQTLNYDGYAAQHHAAYDTGSYDTTAWTDGRQPFPTVPAQADGPETSGQWDSGTWLQPEQSGSGQPADPTQQWNWSTQTFDTGTFDTGAFDATEWNSDGAPEAEPAQATSPQDPAPWATENEPPDTAPWATGDEPHEELTGTGELPAVGHLLEEQEESTAFVADAGTGPVPAPTRRSGSRGANRSRRRPPARRSALLTIAVPSACVMGVAGIAAASVGTLGGEDGQETQASAPDVQPVKPSAANSKLDTQLASLSAGADDFADRASRTQERIDLKAEQDAEKKRAAEEAARKERLRPKFSLPVAQHGLSAYYGQAGVNWMSSHSGIDFPVSYGATVMAATDGTVRTQFNVAYGNMMIVTAKDGTETWYCHLSTYRVPPGSTVKAGDPIAYSGDSGNSTGPHLHFEVRPAGGSAIDPLPWLRSHGLDPT